ncbi:MAG: hypothetical protein HYV63_03130 [Candidatus Schekmanbacteria bacterium]|nr:hypothetical protein [Candidatus Schekmanbacteria bacterium]
MRRLLKFLVISTTISFAMGACWSVFLVSHYITFFSQVANTILHVTGYQNVITRAEGHQLIFLEVDNVLRERYVGTLDGMTLSFNIVPLVGLMLAIPGVPLHRRLANLGIALLAVFFTHCVHMTAGFYSATHASIVVSGSGLWKLAQIASYYALHYIHGFWEVAGALLVPFVIWGVAYPDVIVGKNSLFSLGARRRRRKAGPPKA